MIKLSEKAAKRWDILMVLYAAAAVSYQVLYLIAPIKAFLNLSGLSVLSSGLAVGGALLLLIDFFTQQHCLKVTYGYVLIATLAVLGISSVVHIGTGFANNVKVLIWQAVQMLLVYGVYRRLSAAGARVFMRTMHTAFTAVYVPAVLVAFYQFVFQKGYALVVDSTGGINRQGFLEGRLFGPFTSVHFVSVFLAVMAVGALYFATKTKRVWLKVLYVTEVVLFFIYIVLSGTRSVFVAMALAVFAACFMIFKEQLLAIKNGGLKYLTVVILSLVAGGCLLLAVKTADTQLKKIPVYVQEQQAQQTTTTTVGTTTSTDDEGDPTTESTTSTAPTTTTTKPIVLNRDDGQVDISNNRFKIWGDYVSVTIDSVKTLLFGSSPGEYMNVIRENYPEKYIVTYIRDKYPNMYEQNLIYDTHNGYLSVFVSGGVVCVLVFGFFLVLIAVRVIKKVCGKQPLSPSFMALLTMLIVILVATFFDSDVFFKCTSTSMLFWLLLGFMVKELKPQE